jgi:hypothetical protein
MTETTYTFRYADTGATDSEPFTEAEWFKIFLSGHLRGRPLEWIERQLDREKRVTFAEHVDGTEPQ